jgi:hypothetical protein
MLNLVGSVPAVCNDPSGKVVSMISVTAGHNALSFLTILEWIPVLVDTVPLIIWLVYVV